MLHYRKLKTVMLLLLVCVVAKAQLIDGKVYNFVNVEKAASMSVNSLGSVDVQATDQSNYSQLWYATSEGDGYTLRNLANGHYLKSPNTTSGNWTVVESKDTDCIFSTTAVNGNYAIRVTGNTGTHNYMHADRNGKIVCWESSSTNSQWTMNVIAIESTTLNANWGRLAEISKQMDNTSNYQIHLDNLFSDKACTKLKDYYASVDVEDLKKVSSYQSLPAVLQEMVLKVRNGNDAWGEKNYDENKSDWDADYARKFRVQLYEPYNEPNCASTALSLNWHTNLNNPTGVFANFQELLYIMVEGEIKDGASLYLGSYTGNGKPGDYNQGFELRQGLNVIPSYVAGNNYCINYVVKTFDVSNGKRGHEAKAHSLKGYDPLKIHIEGGYINGYWNKVGDESYTADTNDSWDYIEQRATQTTITVLGKYMTLQFPLRDEDTEGNKGLGSYLNDLVNIEDVITSWDNVMMWERLLLGVLDEATVKAEAKQSPYSITETQRVFEYTGNDSDYPAGYGDYYNVHGLALGVGGDTYMYGSGDHSGYHYNTMSGVIKSMPTDAGSHWGPAHEIGHQHQNLINMRGETEVSNNLFSNMVLWFYGETTSRVNGSDGSLENILKNFNSENGHYLNNSIWGMTQMYYKLFLYYHVLGHNPKFYPRLFEMLRQDPQINNRASTVDGSKAQLHLYKKVCLAAGEDLTEFFRAHGFFKPLDGFSIDDYGTSTYNMTQEQIDAAIAEVKALKYDENISVIFINDATGEEILSHKGDALELYGGTTICAEVGSYASYSNATLPHYNYTISSNTMIMEGEGGTGFAVFNEKGEIIAFSNKKTFQVSDDCVEAIASGKAEVKIINADNTSVDAINIMDTDDTDDTDAKCAMLGELVASAKEILDLSDESDTKLGFYRKASLDALKSAYDVAKQVYDDETIDSYVAVYNTLFQEYAYVMNDDYARIDLVEGNAYRLTNKAYPERSMAIETSEGENKDKMLTLAIAETDAQLWYFVASDSEGRYYLKNKSTEKYPGNVTTGTALKADKTKGEAYAYELRDMGHGIWALVGNTGLHCSASQGYNIVGWGADAEASQWYITAVEVDENAEAVFSLKSLIEKTKDLVGEMANVQYSSRIALQAVSEGEPYHLSTNACHNTLNNATDGQGLAGLLDAGTDTYFHSDYGGKVSGTHYLQVDLGSGDDLLKFAFNYTTRDNGNNCPTEIVVAGSNSADGIFTTLQTYTAADDNLPNGNAKSWESPVIDNLGKYRYMRFSVTGTENNQGFFVMSTFGITHHKVKVKAIEEKYSNQGLTEQLLIDFGEEILKANELMVSDDATSANLQAMYSTIEEAYYTPLLQIYIDANSIGFTALKEELQTLINSTTELINSYGTFEVVGSVDFTLSTTAGSDAYYLTGGPSDPSQGSLDNLLDGDVNTYYVSNWSVQKSAPYLQVQLPDDRKMRKFAFTFTSRNSGNSPTPTAIVVSGSNDGSEFTEIQTFTKEADGFPEAANNGSGKAVKWTSPKITASEAYKYLRFTVTESDRSSNNETDANGYYHFGISEFGLSSVDDLHVTLHDNVSNVTEAQLLATYHEVASAQSVYDIATTEYQLQKAIDKLQAKYDALNRASQETVTISSVGYSTLYLDYPVYIPDGVEVYVISGIEGDYVTLKRVEGVLPANQGAILRNAGTYSFKRATDPTTTVEFNLLRGTVETIATNTIDGVVYTLQKNENGGVVFRRYNGANLNAKKAFLVLSASDEAKALHIRFAEEEGGATSVKFVFEIEDSEQVYDLYGRRVVGLTEGIYIVNGKKVVVK